MSKNAKIAVVVSVLAVIVLIVVLSSTIFSVHRDNLIWYNTPTGTLASLTNETALSTSEADSQSVFLLDREKITQNLEKEYPYLRVISLEVVWPNNLNIHVMQRQEVYAVPISNNRYAITDEYFKVLDIVNTFNSTNTNAILINTDECLNTNAQIADTLDIFGDAVYFNIYNAFLQFGRTLADMRAIIASCELTETTLTIHTHFDSLIKLDKPFANTDTKMRLAIKTFDAFTTEDYKNSVIEVFTNNNNEPEARYYWE